MKLYIIIHLICLSVICKIMMSKIRRIRFFNKYDNRDDDIANDIVKDYTQNIKTIIQEKIKFLTLNPSKDNEYIQLVMICDIFNTACDDLFEKLSKERYSRVRFVSMDGGIYLTVSVNGCSELQKFKYATKENIKKVWGLI
jgi:hypothetical protein